MSAPPSSMPGANGKLPHDPAPQVLVLGSRVWARRLGDRLRAAGDPRVLEMLDDHLLALGFAARHRPPLIVLHTAALGAGADARQEALAALRQVAPQARIVAVAPAGARPDDGGPGADCWLNEPIDAIDLARAITPAADPAVAPREETPTPAAPVAAEAPGDADLVEELLRGQPALLRLALEVVAARSGIADVGCCVPGEVVPAGRVVAPVEYRGQQLAILHAPPSAAAEDLAPWAAWLSRWLALEHKIGRLWDLAVTDELTGLWNRRYFDRFLRMILERATGDRFQVTLMIFDIDDFKLYNDRYGHLAGDDILRETARLLRSVVREHDVVARLGGDEFAVVFWDADAPRREHSEHPRDVLHAAERFRQALREHRFPKLTGEAPGTLTISAGLAGFPWDGRTAEQLVQLADDRALQCKRQGKNAISFGPEGR